ncbi:MAG: glutamate-1-semialdehyde 2,1-aminomutase [Candidatus Omnitrophica bacterium]|nr:glutamate-1-semialdehyde 2,1-aminomutase [Candidatus Omnitrophota bacterium]
MKRPSYTKSTTLFKAAQHVLVGGVNSPVRSFRHVGGEPILVKNARGSRIYDYDRNSYIDYVLSYGALILGHANPGVISAVKKTAEKGLGYGTTHELEVELARRIQEAIPLCEKIRFVSSGTEAVMGAIRLARGFTKRNKILKFEYSYHGHADYLLVKAGSGLATMGLPASKGVPKDFIRHTLVTSYGNINNINKIFKRYGSEIAAVIVEPVGGNNGVIPPDIPFLKRLRTLTRQFSTLLIFDEVITGFRFHFGSAASYFGIKPDMICLGKIIGGGLPIGAYGGSKKIMNHLAPLGSVYQASTFSGNPVVMSAGVATLRKLALLKKDYKKLSEKAALISQYLENKAKSHNIDISVRHFGTMFSVYFKKRKYFKFFYRRLLENGIYFAPSEYESNFISFAHSKEDIKKTLREIDEAFYLLAKRKGRS